MISGGDEIHSTKYKMPGGYRSHFPKINTISTDKLSSLPAALLFEMINKTFYAISQEENRYIYSGLYMKIDQNQITFVGTDGRRLSAITRKLLKPIQLSNEGPQVSDNDFDSDDIVIYSKAIRGIKNSSKQCRR